MINFGFNPAPKPDSRKKKNNKGKSQKEKVREAVIARDGGKWCLICGISRSGLHLHRVVYGSQGGIYDVDNCVLLCDRDHTMVHSNKRLWQPALKAYLQTLDPYEIRSLRDTA